MAPPSTPNPHRFLINTRKQTPASAQHTFPQSSQRFQEKPQFKSTFPPTQRRAFDSFNSSSSVARFSTPAKLVHKESIEDPSSQDALVHGSIENQDGFEEELFKQDNDDVVFDDGGDDDNDQPAAKRHKLCDVEYRQPEDKSIEDDKQSLETQDHDAELLDLDANHEDPLIEPSSSIPILSSPNPEPSKRFPSTPRFRFQTNSLRSTTPLPSLPPGSTAKPPQFVLPALEPQSSPHEPLPDQFSPTRRGQRYIHGGLASTMQNWLLNIESLPTISASHKPRSQNQFAVMVTIDEMSGSSKIGMSMIRGRQIHLDDDGEEEVVDHLGVVNIILAGEGSAEGLSNGGISAVGKKLGIRGPMWEMTVDGQKWGVGVNWKVL